MSALTPSRLPLLDPPPPHEPRLRVWPWMLLTLLWVAPTWIGCWRPRVEMPPQPVVLERPPCVHRAPPLLPSAVRVERSNGLCPYDYAACLRLESAVALAWWIEATIAWEDEILASCGPARTAAERYAFDESAQGSTSAPATDAGAPTGGSADAR